jgi:hypothetical protein
MSKGWVAVCGVAVKEPGGYACWFRAQAGNLATRAGISRID